MPLVAEVQTWVDELKKAGIKDDELAPFLKSVEGNPQAQEFVKGSILRQSDYSKKLNDLGAKEAALAEEIKKADEYAGRLSAWKGTADEEVKTARKEAEELRTKMAGIQERIKTVQKQYGIEDSEFEGVLTSPTVPKNPTQIAPEADYAALKKEFGEVTGRQAHQLPRVAAKMMKLSREHAKLYPDQDFDPDVVLDLCEKESITLDQAAAKLYKYDERREELRKADVQRQIEEAVKAERTKVLSEAHLPTPGVTRPGSPVFGLPKPEPAKDGTTTPAPIANRPRRQFERVQKAVDSFNEQRYLNKGA